MPANGFVPRVYLPFYEALGSRLRIFAMANRALNGFPLPKRSVGWDDLGYDLAQWLDKNMNEPVIAIGHSMGATSLIYAAEKFPRLFRALVLLEPASASARLARLIRWMPWALLKRLHPMRGAAQKRDRWDSEASFLQSCERSGMYKKFNERAMQLMCEHALHYDDAKGYYLCYPKMWEAYNYSQVCDPIPTLKKLKVPVVGIRAQDSFFMDHKRWQRFVSAPSMVWHTQLSDYGHLMPLEGPKACAQAVLTGLEAAGSALGDND